LEWIGKTLLACPDLPKMCGQEALADFNKRIDHVDSQELSDFVRTSVAGIKQTLRQSKVQ